MKKVIKLSIKVCPANWLWCVRLHSWTSLTRYARPPFSWTTMASNARIQITSMANLWRQVVNYFYFLKKSLPSFYVNWQKFTMTLHEAACETNNAKIVFFNQTFEKTCQSNCLWSKDVLSKRTIKQVNGERWYSSDNYWFELPIAKPSKCLNQFYESKVLYGGCKGCQGIYHFCLQRTLVLAWLDS